MLSVVTFSFSNTFDESQVILPSSLPQEEQTHLNECICCRFDDMKSFMHTRNIKKMSTRVFCKTGTIYRIYIDLSS